MGYITAEGRKNVLRYQYRGSNLSLTYKYVFSPWAAYLVDNWTPAWLAPNAITLVGFVLIVVSYFVLAWFCPLLECSEATPGWALCFAAVCLGAYQTLDNMDGKQARKRGASSPLGLLFDHGCDAINCAVLTSATQAILMQTGSSGIDSLVVWAFNGVGFYVYTWSEFHLEELVLPIINGPDEGITIIVTALFVTGWFGPAWLSYQLLPGWCVSRCFFTFTYVAGTITVVGEIVKVCVHEMKAGRGISRPVARLSPMLLVLCSVVVWASLSPEVYRLNPRVFLLPAGLLLSDSMSKLMVSHVCGQKYRPNWRLIVCYACMPLCVLLPRFLPSLPAAAATAAVVSVFFCATAGVSLKAAASGACAAGAALFAASHASQWPQTSSVLHRVSSLCALLPGLAPAHQLTPFESLQLLLVVLMTVVSLLALCHFIYVSISELAAVLGIWCFNITKPRQKLAASAEALLHED